jgi:CubicO group peptidase (beta-lactamase class C family)
VKIVVVAIVILVAIAGSGIIVVTVDSAPKVVSAADAQTIDGLFNEYNRPSVPGAAVAVIHHGRLAFIRTYGLADLETKTPVTERTNFRLASLTKPFTAMAVMLLIRDGRLTLDTRVAELIHDFPAYGREIRIRHLLTHTSGLQAYEDFVSPSPTRHLRDHDVINLLKRTDHLLFRPGTAFRYGDSGYAVLAVVVERVSGRPFAAFLSERIFTPLGMTSTIAWTSGSSTMRHRALGYAATSSGFRPADQSVTSTILGDGGVYSSVRDLVAWDRALDGHKLVGGRLQRLAWTPAPLDDGTKTNYGFGWFIERDGHGTRVYHRGDTSGFSNFIVKYPERKTTLIVLTNRQGGAAADIATKIMTLPSLRVGAQ